MQFHALEEKKLSAKNKVICQKLSYMPKIKLYAKHDVQ